MNNAINLSELVKILTSRWKIISFISLIFLAGFIGFSYLITPIYQIDTTLESTNFGAELSGGNSIGGSLGGIGRILGQSSGSSTQKSALALLKSRGFLAKFIKKNELLPILFKERYLKAQKGEETYPTLWQGTTKLRGSVIMAHEDNISGLVIMSTRWNDPNIALQWSKYLVHDVNEFFRKRDVIRADAEILFLKEKMRTISESSSRQSIVQLMSKNFRILALASKNKDYVFAVLSEPILPPSGSYVFPNRKLFAILGLILGLVTGSVVALMLEQKLKRKQAETVS